MDRDVHDFYATPGRFTTLGAGDFSSPDIGEVVDVVQGLLIYDMVAQPFYGVELSSARAEAIHEREMAGLLAAARAVDDRIR